jgi:tRNA threonylcarbamoyladenosine biosynthesis protein TsaE
MDNDFTLDLADEAATLSFGAALAKAIEPDLTIYLHGDLGAGKTTLVRGLLRGLGFVGKVKSPTYTLVEPYEMLDSHAAQLNLYHFDLYRFNDEEEWEAAGFRDYFNPASVCLIEWPEKASHILPVADIDISFNIKDLVSGKQGRTIHLSANSSHGQRCVQKIKTGLFEQLPR